MAKIAVLGDRNSVLGFRALGLEVFFCDSGSECARLLHRLAREEYAILYITEDLAGAIPEEIAKYNDKPQPAVILIPGREGSTGIARQALQSAIERAVGADIS